MKLFLKLCYSVSIILMLNPHNNILFAQSVPNTLDKMTDKGVGYLEYLPADYATSTEKYPVLIFLHGSGESGNGTTDLPKLTAHSTPYWISSGQTTMTYTDTVTGKTLTFIVIMPQTNDGWGTDKVDGIINYALANYRVDTCRVYLTGISMGGFGSWNYSISSYNKKNRFAAMVVSDGTCLNCDGCIIAERGVPVWALHGGKDDPNFFAQEQAMIAGINACTTPVANPKAKYTIYPNDGHGVWAKTYFPNNKYNKPNVFEWMLAYTLTTCPQITSTTNADSEHSIKAFPNPISNSISISNESSKVINSISMYNSKGTILLEKKNMSIQGEGTELDISTLKLNQGVYILKIGLSDGTFQNIKLSK